MGENFFERYFGVLVVFVLLSAFFVSVLGFVFATNCSLGDAEECMLSKENLMPDFYWHYNTIKYVAAYGEFPFEVPGFCDGGPNGDLGPDGELCGPLKGMYHSPLYYFLGAGVFNIADSFEISNLLVLHSLTIIIIAITNLLFLLLLIELARRYKLDKKFIIFSLAIFAFLPVHLFYGAMVYDGVLYYPFLIATIYMFVRLYEKSNLRNSIALGLVAGLSLLSFLAGVMSFIAMGILFVSLYLKKKYYKAKFLFLSMVIGSVVGAYPFIRNFLTFGNPMGPFLNEIFATDLFRIPLYFNAFWGGIYGGVDSLFIPLVFSSLFLTLLTFYSIFKNFKKVKELRFVLLVALLSMFFLIHLSCNLLDLIKTGVCTGRFGHGKYLISLNPIIAIYSSLLLVNIKKFKTLIAILVFLILIVFSVDFLFALR